MPSLESIISSVSATPLYSEQFFGACARTVRPVAQFLAPIINVGSLSARIKVRTKDYRLQITDYSFNFSESAVKLGFALDDKIIQITPRAADIDLFNLIPETAAYMLRQALTTMAIQASEDHEIRTIQAAVAAAGSGSSVSFSQSADDPIETIDSAIEALMLSGQSQECGVIFGSGAWRLFKANANVRAATKGELSWDQNPSIFHGSTPFMTSTAFYDSAPLEVAPNFQFLFPTNSLLIFTRTSQETTDGDPSFMKSFVADPQSTSKETQKPLARAVLSPDGRKVIVAGNWTADPLVTSEIGCTLLNAS